jgi:hypothetical protein
VKRMIKMFGLSLAAMLAFGALSAASASALEWQNNGSAITVPVNVKTSGTLDLTDVNGGIFGEEVTVRCNGTGTGTVGPGVADKVETVNAAECITVKGTCATEPKVKAINLPWDTELIEAESTVRNKILNSGQGAPGWQVECNFGITNVCVSENGSTLQGNLGGPAVTATFDALSGTADCTRGGKEAGFVRGELTVEAAEEGDSISIKK